MRIASTRVAMSTSTTTAWFIPTVNCSPGTGNYGDAYRVLSSGVAFSRGDDYYTINDSYGKDRSPDFGYGNYGICAYLVRPSGDFNYVDNYVSDSYGNKNRYTLIEYT